MPFAGRQRTRKALNHSSPDCVLCNGTLHFTYLLMRRWFGMSASHDELEFVTNSAQSLSQQVLQIEVTLADTPLLHNYQKRLEVVTV